MQYVSQSLYSSQVVTISGAQPGIPGDRIIACAIIVHVHISHEFHSFIWSDLGDYNLTKISRSPAKQGLK